MTGVYGVPRGGLCLAVALNHAIERPLLSVPEPSALIVDDVYETGRTLQAEIAGAPVSCRMGEQELAGLVDGSRGGRVFGMGGVPLGKP